MSRQKYQKNMENSLKSGKKRECSTKWKRWHQVHLFIFRDDFEWRCQFKMMMILFLWFHRWKNSSGFFQMHNIFNLFQSSFHTRIEWHTECLVSSATGTCASVLLNFHCTAKSKSSKWMKFQEILQLEIGCTDHFWTILLYSTEMKS